MSPGTRIVEQTSCWGRGWGPRNGDFMCRQKKKGFIFSALSEHWISLFWSLLIGGGRISCWCGLDHPRRDCLLPSRQLVIGLFRLLPWPIRCTFCLHLGPWGPTLLEVLASSRALLSGVPLQEICDVVGWFTPHTFIRFYSLNLPSMPGARVLSS